jgi:hypothetical protein
MMAQKTSLLAAMLAFASVSADDFAQWPHGQTLYTNTSPDGAYVTSAVKRFPLLVRLDSANFAFSEARKDGGDLRFADPDGKHLPYQIERWDSAGKAAAIWVLMDSVRGNSVTPALRMLWGKADAADSSNGAAVFDSADGYTAVWHLGGRAVGDTLPRPNAVAGGLPAAPVGYEGDEARPGLIGLADSLDGAGKEDYLDLGQGYADVNHGFTYSVWANATNQAFWSRLLDLGNGIGVDNLVMQRNLSGTNLDFDSYDSADGNTRVTAKQAFGTGSWQHFAVTVDGKAARLYVDGVLAASETLKDTLRAVARTKNYIGKSNWPGNDYFMGLIDEPRLSRKALSADRIKLDFANQRPGQTFLSFLPPGNGCTARFEVPKDTVVPEGSMLELAGIADCAEGYGWEVVSGPAPRILDPEVKALTVAVPRVTKDQILKYRFNGRYGGGAISKDVLVTVTEAIPDPAFTLPAGTVWNGRDSVLFKPKVSNLAAIKAGPDSLLNWAWTLAEGSADTAWRDSALLLRSAEMGTTFKIGLCLDNGGTATCRIATVTVAETPTALAVPPAMRPDGSRKAYDARGRRLGADAIPKDPIRRALAAFGFFR